MYSVYSFPILIAFILYLENPSNKDPTLHKKVYHAAKNTSNATEHSTSSYQATTHHSFKDLADTNCTIESEDVESSLIKMLGSSHHVYKMALKNNTGVRLKSSSPNSTNCSITEDLLNVTRCTPQLLEFFCWLLFCDFVIIIGLVIMNVIATTFIGYVMKCLYQLHMWASAAVISPLSAFCHIDNICREIISFKKRGVDREQSSDLCMKYDEKRSSHIQDDYDDTHSFQDCCDTTNGCEVLEGNNDLHIHIFPHYDNDLYSGTIEYSFESKEVISPLKPPAEFSPKKLKKYLREKYLELDRLGIIVDENRYLS